LEEFLKEIENPSLKINSINKGEIQQKIIAQRLNPKETIQFFEELYATGRISIEMFRCALEIVVKEMSSSDAATLIKTISKGDIDCLVTLLGVGKWGGIETVYGSTEPSLEKTAVLVDSIRKQEDWNIEKTSSFICTISRKWVITHSEPQFSLIVSILTAHWEMDQLNSLLKQTSEHQNWSLSWEDSIMFFHHFQNHCKKDFDIAKLFHHVTSTWNTNIRKVMSSWLAPSQTKNPALVLCSCGLEVGVPRDWSIIDSTYGPYRLHNQQQWKEHLKSSHHIKNTKIQNPKIK